jgi:hypothetical protein
VSVPESTPATQSHTRKLHIHASPADLHGAAAELLVETGRPTWLATIRAELERL